ncbi:MAG: alpha/beta fold hydrolase [bacterium]|nr:alpha/beta fold hydrolase [bacterium]
MIRAIISSLAMLCLLASPALAEGSFMKRLHDRMAAKQDGNTATIEIAGLKTAYWLPETDAPAPLIIFSHGFGGCKTQSKFLMLALATHGYVVVAPDHADAMCGMGMKRPEEKFSDIEKWTDQTYKNRGDDIRNLYAALKADETWRQRIDWKRVALAGHSLGGYTAVGLAGGWPSWKMDGIGAVLALSPYVGPYVANGDLAHLGAPVMYQGGTRDAGITPMLKKEGGAYDKTSSPAYFVEFEKTGHLGWTDLSKASQTRVVDYSLWFLDHALNKTDVPLPRETGVSDIRAK